MSNSLSNDQMLVLNHYYPEIYTQVVSESGSQVKSTRRRKKSKGESSNSGFKKRKLSDEQVKMLELHFESEHKLDSERKDRLASELGLDPRQVAVWFQNRRARWKSKKLEEDYSKLKSEHECTVSEKCLLKTEVLELKERLSEMQSLLREQSNRASSNSRSSSLSAGVTEPPVLGEFGMEGLESVFCAAENNYDAHGMEYWPYLYDM